MSSKNQARKFGLAAQALVEIGKRPFVVEPLRAGDPAIGPGHERRNRRRCAGAGDLDEQSRALLLSSRAVGFRRSGVPNRRSDLQRAMPVAKRKIVELGFGGARGIDGIGGFALVPEIDDGAVREPDAQGAGRRHRAVHPRRNIIELGFAEERRREQECIVAERKRGRREVEVDVRRKPELRDAIPDALGTMRIVVAGQQVPVHIGERLHAFDRRAQRVRVGSLAVVNVAGNEDVVNAIARGVCTEALDGGKTRVPQRLFLGAELLEDLADLPVGGMNDLHDDFLSFDVATGSAYEPAFALMLWIDAIQQAPRRSPG